MKAHRYSGRFLIGCFGILAIFVLSCSDNKSTNVQGEFDVYGRIVYRPTLAQTPSAAEFYLYHNGTGIGNAVVKVGNDTIPAVDSIPGYYHRDMTAMAIGDTFAYTITTQFGSDAGTVIIPDTVSIIRPRVFPNVDTLRVNDSIFVAWNQVRFIDGYYIHLGNQQGREGVVRESPLDTLTTLAGKDIVSIGSDKIWVEALHGEFIAHVTPRSMAMPKGVVGAAGNYREIYIAP